jgi:hypothetical protein
MYSCIFLTLLLVLFANRYGSTGETRRKMVERQRLERAREEEAALSFKPLLIAKSPKKKAHNNGPIHKREAFVDKELTFSPQITEKAKHLERPKRNSKETADLLFHAAGAGRSRDSIEHELEHGKPSRSSAAFTPQITTAAKRLAADEKLKGGPRLYARSQSLQLERQIFTPSKTKEEQECTFTPVSREQ